MLDRTAQIRRFEEEAEILVAYQLDLLAQLEHHLRSVHHTMRHIEKLRSVRHRVGPELSNGERGDTLTRLDAEVEVLERELDAQRDMCRDMHGIIEKMQVRLKGLRERPAQPHDAAAGSEDSAGE